MKAGSIYAVCSGNDLIHAKLGYTTHVCPEQYCMKTYGRMLPNLQIIRIEPVENGRLGETMLFELLQRFRVMKRREIFAIRDWDVINNAFDEILDFFSKVRLANPNVPTASCLSLQEMEATRVVHTLVKEIFSNVVQNCREEDRARQEAVEKEQEDREVVRNLVSRVFKRVVKSHKSVEMKEKIDAENLAKQSRQDKTCVELLQRFFDRECIIGSHFWINTTELLTEFNSHMRPSEPTKSVQLKRVMKLFGFENANDLGPRMKIRGYRGLAMRRSAN